MPKNVNSVDLRQLLNTRSKQLSKLHERSDPFHLALVVECGGMRGVVAAGFLKTLSSYGLNDIFDSIHGSSAGACASAYFVSNQTSDGAEIYHTDICNRGIVNPWRFYSAPCMVNTDYIADHIISVKRLLDTGKILDNPGFFNIITTCASSGRPVIHNKFSKRSDIITALKATLRIPGIREKGVTITCKQHLDGGIIQPIPMYSAELAGATHILVVGTQREHEYSAGRPWLKYEAALLGYLYSPGLKSTYLNANDPSLMVGPNSFSGHGNVEFLCRPKNSTPCNWYTIDKQILKSSENEAITAAERFLASAELMPRQTHL